MNSSGCRMISWSGWTLILAWKKSSLAWRWWELDVTETEVRMWMCPWSHLHAVHCYRMGECYRTSLYPVALKKVSSSVLILTWLGFILLYYNKNMFIFWLPSYNHLVLFTIGLSYFSVAVIGHHNQGNLQKTKGCWVLQLQRVRMHDHHGRDMAASRQAWHLSSSWEFTSLVIEN